MLVRTAVAAFVVCAIPRFVVLWIDPAPEHTFYWFYSSMLLEHGVLGQPGAPDTVVEPLYPAFLAAARLLTGDTVAAVLAIQIIIASLAGTLLYRLTLSLTLSSAAAWTATMFYAFDPYLVRQSVGLIELTMLIALLIAIAWSERRDDMRGSVLAGAFTGAAILVRFSVAPLAVLVPLLFVRRSVRHAMFAAVAVAVMVTPWAIRNHRIDRSIAPSRMGINLAVSLSDAAEQLLPVHNNDRLVPLLEEKTDRELLASAFAFAKANPWRTVKMKLRNFVHVFNPRLLPYDVEPQSARLRVDNGRYWIEGGIHRSPTSQFIHGLWRGTLLVLGIVGLAMRGFRWDDGVLWAVVVTITAVCTVFYPTTRLTTPMVFAFMIWSAHAVRSMTSVDNA
jgi:dolichyl-phosphate-mannose-protein mannosyltransferase